MIKTAFNDNFSIYDQNSKAIIINNNQTFGYPHYSNVHSNNISECNLLQIANLKNWLILSPIANFRKTWGVIY